MSYVQQLCDGFSKKSLMGNWYEQRLYPKQPFRENPHKQARIKDAEISCLDGTGFQRALPRLQRRNKWETNGRIILNDSFKIPDSTTKASYSFAEIHTSALLMKQPFSKNNSVILPTQLHPHSQIKILHKQSNFLNNHSAMQNVNKTVDYEDFRQKIPNYHQNKKHLDYNTSYKLQYLNPNHTLQNKHNQDFAGQFNQNPEEAVKISTTMVGEYKHDTGDEKQRTNVQRSWVPPRDKSLIFGAQKTVSELKKATILENDIQTSLNINKGIHNIHPKNVANNYFGKHLTDITSNPNISPCSR